MLPLINYQSGNQPEVTFDMTDVLSGQVTSATRRFVKEHRQSVLIEDRIVPSDSTRSITWAMMTLADVQPIDNGAVLLQDGKELKLTIIEPKNLNISVISLDPPPMEIDKRIENLKRIEFTVPAYFIQDKEGNIRVRLSIEENK